MDAPIFRAARFRKRWQHLVAAPPASVFPLLCPVREREWVPGWEAEIVFSASGLAEDGCVFRTDFPGRGRGTWVVDRWEPPRRIGFVVFYPDLVDRLEVELTAAPGGGTELAWTRTYTTLSETGNAQLAASTEALDSRMRDLLRHLERFCGGPGARPPASAPSGATP